MFFKRGRDNKSSLPAGGSTAVDAVGSVPLEPATRHRPLDADALRRTIDPATLGFASTAELEPISGLIGQDRALRAIEFGADMKANDFNIFVLGPAASGKATAVRAYLTGKAAQRPAPKDWIYVYNFDNANRPRAIPIPSGRARDLDKGMIAAIDELRLTLPSVFEGEEYQTRRRAIEQEYRATPGGGVRGADPQGARPEYCDHAHADRLRHGPDA